jgi:ribonuclease P protein subunit RPR2
VRRKNNAAQARDIARERIELLFMLAMLNHPLHPERSDRYVQIARKISMRTRVGMPSRMKRMFCKHCGCYLPASGRRVRLIEGVISSTCLKCGKQSRIPYKESQSVKL